jgi:hypothetical protein
VSRVLLVAVMALLLLAAGCGDDDENGGGGEDRAETTEQEPVYPTASPSGPIADPIDIPPPRRRALEDAADAAGCELKHPKEEASHVNPPQTVAYRSDPPTSGAHWPIPADDGAYLREQPRPEELVHSLEHGRIVIHAATPLEQDAKGGLQALFDEDASHMLLVITNDLPYDVAATAWGHLLGCTTMSGRVYDAIRAFKARYRDKGPERVP